MANKGIVYLVGAGPGDPGLLTLRGKECLQKAEVVVYDRLVGKALLDWTDSQAEKIYVGKSPENHALEQQEINQLLADKALEGKIVTRLKGGDPFVFGRGGEEAEVLQAQGVPFEIVPGITSAIAVPAYAGIPVTHRGLTSTLTLITGNEDPGKADSSLNWQAISEIGGTLVFLMGMGNLRAITAQLLKGGRKPNTPVALIRWGTRPQQRTLLGTLQNIAALAEEADFKNPAIILVGEVVQMREKLQWFENRPLFGQRILVTRSREQASSLSEKIRQLGGEAVEFPTIQIAPPQDSRPLEQAVAQIESYQWIILTSVNGVKFFFEYLRKQGKDARHIRAKIGVIGPKTREALAAYQIIADFEPSEYRAESIAEGLRGQIKPGDLILLPRADLARSFLPEALRQMGGKVTEVAAYSTQEVAGQAEAMQKMLREEPVQMITFTSSSTVRNFVRLLGRENHSCLQKVKLACIGSVTAQTLEEELKRKADIVARKYTIEGLVQAILEEAEN